MALKFEAFRPDPFMLEKEKSKNLYFAL